MGTSRIEVYSDCAALMMVCISATHHAPRADAMATLTRMTSRVTLTPRSQTASSSKCAMQGHSWPRQSIDPLKREGASARGVPPAGPCRSSRGGDPRKSPPCATSLSCRSAYDARAAQSWLRPGYAASSAASCTRHVGDARPTSGAGSLGSPGGSCPLATAWTRPPF